MALGTALLVGATAHPALAAAASPSLVTHALASVGVGGLIQDVATLSGGSSPTGTITFHVYGPNDSSCSGLFIASAIAPVSGNGDYSSGPLPTSSPGVYRWVASYSGDPNNVAAAGACNAAGETSLVRARAPTVAIATPVNGSTYTLGQAVRRLHLRAGARQHDHIVHGDRVAR